MLLGSIHFLFSPFSSIFVHERRDTMFYLYGSVLKADLVLTIVCRSGGRPELVYSPVFLVSVWFVAILRKRPAWIWFDTAVIIGNLFAGFFSNDCRYPSSRYFILNCLQHSFFLLSLPPCLICLSSSYPIHTLFWSMLLLQLHTPISTLAT